MDVDPSMMHKLTMDYVAAARSRDYGRAKRILRKFVALEPASARFYIHISGVCSEEGDFAEAIGLLSHSKILDPNDGSLHLALAYCYEAVGQIHLAKSIIEKELARDPGSFILRQLSLSLAMKDNDHAVAAEIAEDLLQHPEIDKEKFVDTADLLISLMGPAAALQKFKNLSVRSTKPNIDSSVEAYRHLLTEGVKSPDSVDVCRIQEMEQENLCHRLPLSEHRKLLHIHDAYIGISSQTLMVQNKLCRDFCYHIESDASSDIVRLPNTRFGTKKNFNFIDAKEAILVGGGSNYYHWMIDYLPNLGILEKTGILRNVPVIFNANLTSFQKQSLEHIGFDFSRHLDPGDTKIFRCSQLWATVRLPGRRHIMGVPDWWQSEVDIETLSWLRDSFLGKSAGEGRQGKRKLYLSRGNSRSRRLLNDGEVVDLMMAAGYEIVHPELLSVADQVSLFANASHVVGVHGAAFTNITFMPSGSKILEIVGNFKPPEFYKKISDLLGLNHEFIEGSINKIHKTTFSSDPRFGDIFIDMSKLKRKLSVFDDSFCK